MKQRNRKQVYENCFEVQGVRAKCHMKKYAQDLIEKVLIEFKCMKYVEFCKFCLSHPSKLKTKVDLSVLCIYSYVPFLVPGSNWRGHPVCVCA